MLTLRPGNDIPSSIATLRSASENARALVGTYSGPDLLLMYNEWVVNNTQVFKGVVSPSDLEQLFLTRRYWSVQSMNVQQMNSVLLSRVLAQEMKDRALDLDTAASELEAANAGWGRGGGTVAVLDTSALLTLGTALGTTNWHTMLDVRRDSGIYPLITMAAVDELDAKKRSRDQSGHGQTVRAQARATLRALDEMFPTPDARPRFINHESIPSTGVFPRLLTDELNHVRLPDMDSEIIDRGKSLEPFARVIVVTYDLGMVFRARAAGVEAKQLVYPDETDD